MLTLSEQFLILAINDEGRVINTSGGGLCYGLAGGLLADLLQNGKVGIESDRRLLPLEGQFSGDEWMDEILTAMREKPEAKKLLFWINALGTKKTLKRTLERLVAKGILREEERRYLWIIPYEVFPQQDIASKFWLKAVLRSGVLRGEEITPDQRVLLSLLKGAGMLRLIFSKEELRLAEEQIERLAQDEPLGREVAHAVADAEASASAAMVMMAAG